MKNIIKVSVFSFIFLSFFAQSMQSKPEVLYAWYGNDDPKYMPNNEKTAQQVVNKLRSIVDKYGFIAIPADQHKFYGFDPIPNVKKTTAIHIRHLGKEIGNLRAPEGIDFVYPTNTDKNLVQKAFQEIKATLTTAPEPSKGVPSSSPAPQPSGQAPSSPQPARYQNIFPDICLGSKAKDQQRIEESGVVFYFVTSGNDFKGVPLEKKVCSVISDYIPPLTGIEDDSFSKFSSQAIIAGTNLRYISSQMQNRNRMPSHWGYVGLFAEACPDAIIKAQTMINAIQDPNKISLKLSKNKKTGSANPIFIDNGTRSLNNYDDLGEVIGVIINKFSFSGNCYSGSEYYAITPVPSPTNPFFKIIQTIHTGNLEAFKHIIESESINVNQPLAWNQTTPLVESIRSKQREIAHYLISQGAFITESDEKLIIDANMYKQLAPLIIEHARQPISKVLLEEMIKQNDTALVQLALQKKLVEPKLVIEIATKYNNYELVNLASQAAITNNKESK